MPFALDGTTGHTIIESRGICHDIAFTIDPIRREPKIKHTTGSSLVKNGTRITVYMPETPWSEEADLGSWFLQVGHNFAALNPHLSLKLPGIALTCSNPSWTKSTPADPIPAHWYSDDRFDRLIGAHIADDQDNHKTTTVREFVAIFRGMSGTAKQMSGTAKQKAVLEASSTARTSLADFYANGDNRDAVRRLLGAMQESTKSVKADGLGMIGREHIALRFAEAGAEMETFEYVRRTGEARAGLPFVLEVAFAWCTKDVEERRLITGLNFSPTLTNPFRSLGTWGTSLDRVLTDQYVGDDEPVIALVHLTCPVVAFTDRGKSQLILDHPTGEEIRNAVLTVTKKWHRTRKHEDKHAAEVQRRYEKMIHRRRISVKEAAYSAMEEAWLKASAGGTLPANARQIMYAARPKIQELIGKSLDDKYFTQTLLPDFVAERGVDWDVVYDDRGHFIEPRGGQVIGIGTLSVRRYLTGLRASQITDGRYTSAAVSTDGPQGNYGAVVFIEKEGFLPLLKRVDLGNRLDVGIMSTKGASLTAARQLAERICSERGIPLYILHDLDKAGFSIKATLHEDTRRYQLEDRIQAVDLGLRLNDVIELGLEDFAEAVSDDGSREARAKNLRKNGATEEEIQFLLDRRVELDAMTSEQFVEFVERKRTEHGGA
jgi:DNA topoisomerase VI subunit B